MSKEKYLTPAEYFEMALNSLYALEDRVGYNNKKLATIINKMQNLIDEFSTTKIEH